MAKLKRQLSQRSAQQAAAARRGNLFLFLQLAFKVLHPGKELVPADYLEALCFQLQEMAEGRNPRLVVNMPPRYLKSIVAAVIFPAWVIGRWPERQILVACYGDELAREHSQMFRALIESAHYRATFANVQAKTQSGRLHVFHTSAGGGRRAVTLGGAVTGFGADMVIVDDIMKAADATSEVRRNEVCQYFDGTLLSRLNDKLTGTIVAIQQRLHQNDLPAHLLEKGGYRHMNLPAICRKEEEYQLYFDHVWQREKGSALCSEREGLDTLEQIKREQGGAIFETQYQQDPTAGATSMVDLDRLYLVDGVPEDHRLLRAVQAWDTAILDSPQADYSVCATLGWDGERWLLVDVVRERLDYENLKARAVQLRKRWDAEAVMVEKSANGSNLVMDMRRSGFYEYVAIPVTDAKTARFARAAEWLHTGEIGILHECSWFPDLRRELVAFPNGRHDDQVDAISLFVKKMAGRRAIDPKKQLREPRLRAKVLATREALERMMGIS